MGLADLPRGICAVQSRLGQYADLPPLVRELKLLQRVAGRTGKESVEHPRGSHDDLANSVCGCLQF
jgi:hypothetical protein